MSYAKKAASNLQKATDHPLIGRKKKKKKKAE